MNKLSGLIGLGACLVLGSQFIYTVYPGEKVIFPLSRLLY